MSDEQYFKKEPFGFGGIVAPDIWYPYSLHTLALESGHAKEIEIVNGGVNNKRIEGNVWISFRAAGSGPETCSRDCGEVISLGPGDSYSRRVDNKMELWLQWDNPDIAIVVQETSTK